VPSLLRNAVQRRWLLSVHPSPPLQHELELCTKFLSLDERNCGLAAVFDSIVQNFREPTDTSDRVVHCWDYRRHVVGLLGAEDAVDTELAFTEVRT
jgi:hypothetical protein